jgi:hypothetical protein
MSQQPDIFVSYSHEHKELVGPLVSLLQVGNRFIFYDKDTLKPGDKWENVLMASLHGAKCVVVIWCVHADKSEWVKKESELAATLNKTLIPVILDATPLPDYLSKYQWIDFRGAFQHEKPSWWTAFFGVALMLMIGVFVFLVVSANSRSVHIKSPEDVSSNHVKWLCSIGIFVGVGIWLLLEWIKPKRWIDFPSPMATPLTPGDALAKQVMEKIP